jgi:hypothetical protein
MNRKIKKVVIWGHLLDTHTHSYIHGAFFKAFKSLGYDTYWIGNNDDVSGMDFNDTLFITESQVDSNIPIIKNSYYVLHNCSTEKYINGGCKCLNIQTLKENIRNNKSLGIHLNNYTVLYKGGIDILYMCWGTDLLPDEIDLNNAKNNSGGCCVWIGTYGGGESKFENWSNLDPFFEMCKINNIDIININPWSKPVSFEENIRLINNSYIAPAIQGKWQVDNGYIPCRIFKNISYGHYGYTNSKSVMDIFDGPLIYSPDIRDLFNKIIENKNNNLHIDNLKYLMEEVKNKHTYINRINDILECLPD